jgi:hypothetical protein
VVDPGLQGRGDGKIVHRHCEHDRVGVFELGDERIGERQELLLPVPKMYLRPGQSLEPATTMAMDDTSGNVAIWFMFADHVNGSAGSETSPPSGRSKTPAPIDQESERCGDRVFPWSPTDRSVALWANEPTDRIIWCSLVGTPTQ